MKRTLLALPLLFLGCESSNTPSGQTGGARAGDSVTQSNLS